ncbi:MAG: hypothetical protein M3158_02330 [Pseudomonadota bacterium]|jgi:hypothetical protein|nr:hypothetical protein [Pseudomonadota bacterium]
MTGNKGKRLAAADGAADNSHEPKLDRMTQTRLGDQLRAMYDELVGQPVPDRFKDLLDRLEKGGTPEKAR